MRAVNCRVMTLCPARLARSRPIPTHSSITSCIGDSDDSATLMAALLTRSHKYGNMSLMKTTLEIPDAIFRRAKTVAAQRGIPFRALVSEALADKLRAQDNKE